MTEKNPNHPDHRSGARAIRSSGSTDAPMIASDASPDFSLFRASTNLDDTALDVIRPIVLGENATIVTGYENLMSVLAMVMSLRPGLSFADRSALRILLTEQDRPVGRVAHAARMTADRLTAHFLRPSGVYVPDPRDLRAIGAKAALASGAIMVRIVNPEKLKRTGKHIPEGVQANMVVGEDFAAISTAGFSRRDLLDRVVVIDRVASDGVAFAARRDVTEAFWAAGNPCNREVNKILDEMLTPVGIEQAMSSAIRTTMSYDPFQSAVKDQPVRSDLVAQALARVYENGFAFVSVPAGAGHADVQDEITRRLENNAARMIGGGGAPEGAWCAHVETATGGRWTDEKIKDLFAARAPLALDGSIAPKDKETVAEAAFRRMKCRLTARVGKKGRSDFEGFPEIRTEKVDMAATKGQVSSSASVMDEIDRALEGALDATSQKELERLAVLAELSSEAALFVWKQGGMNTRVRTTSKGAGGAKEADQNILPMFLGSEIEDVDAPDIIGEALAARAFRSIDKSKIKMTLDLVERHGQVLCFVENDLVRHALARKAAEMSEAPVLAVLSEAAMRAEGIPGREASYQRAESPDVAMSMLAGNESGPVIVFASVDHASEMTLPRASVAVALSVPSSVDRVAAGMSCIDGLGKEARVVTCFTLDDGISRTHAEKSAILTNPGSILTSAAAQMRTTVAEARDGVADIMSDLQSRIRQDVVPPEQGTLNITTVESRDPFSVFVVSGTSEEADRAAMPPRIIVIYRDPANGEEIVLRNQVGCADFLSQIEIPEPVEDPRVHPELPGMDTLDVIGRHLSHLTHWDARPERIVASMERLAEFVSLNEGSGEEVLSDLCLVSLEIVARRWAHHLFESRNLAGVTEPGLDKAYEALQERPVWEVDEIRDEMIKLIDWRIVEDASRPKTLHDRVVAVIHGTGEADLKA